MTVDRFHRGAPLNPTRSINPKPRLSPPLTGQPQSARKEGCASMSPGAPAGDRTSSHHLSSPYRHRPRPRRLLLPPPALALTLLFLLLLLSEPSSTMTTTAVAFLLAPARRGRLLSIIGLRHQPAAAAAAAAAATAAASLLRHYHPHHHTTRHRGGRGLPQVMARAAAAASTLSDVHPPRPCNETASSGVVGDQRPAPPTLVVVEEEEEEETEAAVFAALVAKLESDESEATDGAGDEEGIDALLGALRSPPHPHRSSFNRITNTYVPSASHPTIDPPTQPPRPRTSLGRCASSSPGTHSRSGGIGWPTTACTTPARGSRRSSWRRRVEGCVRGRS